MKKKLLIVVLSLTIFILSGCQASPGSQSVISKNNGDFESALTSTQTVENTIPSQIQLVNDFYSTDGSVQFHLNISQTITVEKMPAVEVIPMTITSEDMQRVAKALLGEVQFYEREPSSNPQYSKFQYQKMLSRLTPYANMTAMTELVGEDQAEIMLNNIKQIIDWITNALESAPEDNPHTVCDWTFKKERIYNNSTEDIGNRTLAEDSDWLVATAEKDGMGYTYMVVTRNQDDYKLNRFILQLGGASIDTYTDRLIYWSKLCRTGEPTQEQIETVQDKVMDLLDKMELGEWHIADVSVEVYEVGTEPEYFLQFYAVPVLNGVPAIYGQENLSASEDYTGAYALTQASFLMSANGDLLHMELDSPVEIKSLLNDNVTTLSFTQLSERIQQHLSLSDASEFAMDTFGLSTVRLEELETQWGEELVCSVDINQMEFGLGRVMVENTTDSYYYVPVLLLRGKASFVGASTGKVYLNGYTKTLLCINAVDGSIVS